MLFPVSMTTNSGPELPEPNNLEAPIDVPYGRRSGNSLK